MCFAELCSDACCYVVYSRFVAVLFQCDLHCQETRQLQIWNTSHDTLEVTLEGEAAASACPMIEQIIHTQLIKYHSTEWRDMLATVSCAGPFWMNGMECNMFHFQPEVIDLTLDDDKAKKNDDMADHTTGHSV